MTLQGYVMAMWNAACTQSSQKPPGVTACVKEAYVNDSHRMRFIRRERQRREESAMAKRPTAKKASVPPQASEEGLADKVAIAVGSTLGKLVKRKNDLM